MDEHICAVSVGEQELFVDAFGSVGSCGVFIAFAEDDGERFVRWGRGRAEGGEREGEEGDKAQHNGWNVEKRMNETQMVEREGGWKWDGSRRWERGGGSRIGFIWKWRTSATRAHVYRCTRTAMYTCSTRCHVFRLNLYKTGR